MPTVDELGRAELIRLAERHSPAEIARVRAEVAEARAREARAHYVAISKTSIEASREARAALGTDAFQALFDRHRALHGAAQVAFRTFTRARMKADRLIREANVLARRK